MGAILYLIDQKNDEPGLLSSKIREEFSNPVMVVDDLRAEVIVFNTYTVTFFTGLSTAMVLHERKMIVA